MAAPAEKPERVEVGFSGGQVLVVRLAPKPLADLRKAVEAGRGWHEAAGEDGSVSVDVSQVCFIRAGSGECHIGFID